MRFYDRYMAGETKAVYNDIYELGQDAFSPENLSDIEMVLKETFTRVAFNLDLIYNAMSAINYQFRSGFTNNFEKPLHPPLPDTDLLLEKLDGAVSEFGYVPLSLKFFYSIVGGVNFSWDYGTDEHIGWPMADPIQIVSLDALVAEVTDPDWAEMVKEAIEDGQETVELDLAPDVFHKDNISGGPAYAIALTNSKSIDSLFLNEPHDTTFIDYLRTCFEHCGFPGLKREDNSGYCMFFDKVKPNLLAI